MMDKLNGCIFLTEDLLEKYNNVWDKANANIKTNLLVKLSIIKSF